MPQKPDPAVKIFRLQKKAGRVYGNQQFGADEISIKTIVQALT